MNEYVGYLFCYFTGEENTLQDEQVYFAVSKDGLHWVDLNEGKPILQSEVGERGVRDPFILRMEDKDKYIIVATDLQMAKGKTWDEAVNKGSTSLVIWESEDLIHWSAPRLFDTGVQGAGCAWAPEVIYDEVTQDYMIFWAAKTGIGIDRKHCIYCCRTTDFKKFTIPELYIEREEDIIDTTIIRANKKYYRFSKDECSKRIIMESSETLEKEHFVQCRPLGLEQLEGVEGPIIFKVLDEEKWYLLVDSYQKGEGYLPLVTTDLDKGVFEVLPQDAYDFGRLKKRHGSVMYLTDEEWRRLQ